MQEEGAQEVAETGGAGRTRHLAVAVLSCLALAGAASIYDFRNDIESRRRFADTEFVAHIALEADAIAARLHARSVATAEAAAAAPAADLPEAELAAWNHAALDVAAHPLSAPEHAELARLRASLARLQEVALESRRSVPPQRDGPADREYFESVEAARALLLASVHAATEGPVLGRFTRSQIATGVILAATCAAIVLGVWLGALYNRLRQRDRQAIGALGELLRTDPLTGAINRRGLDEGLPAEMARSARAGAPLSVVMMDLDFFKRYNSRRGHAGGDALLRTAAQRWRKQLRPSDLLVRYGGEEFTLVLPLCDADQAHALVERLRPVMPDGQTFSAGIATWDGQEGPADILRRSDHALLAAKKQGRNRTVVSGREDQISLPLSEAI